MERGWSPMDDMLAWYEQMNRFFTDLAQRRGQDAHHDAFERIDWYPAADVYEQDDEYIIALDLPGITRSSLDITLDQGTLQIQGERAPEGRSLQRPLRPYGRFLQRFNLPATINEATITADNRDGGLRVRLPKRAAQRSHRVEIKVGDE